ncbi:MAG: phosphodiester glycosidase family protein [bacterium]|nr:phosphodiester glycosidase family protein [bacterium]
MKISGDVLSVAVLISSWFLTSAGFTAWQNVGPGIDYSSYTIAGPVRIFVTRMSRSSTNLYIDTCLGQGKLRSFNNRETVSGMANRYNDSLSYWGSTTSDNKYWGNRAQVIAVINGDFFDINSTGDAINGVIHSGWFCKSFSGQTYPQGNGFVWKSDRTCALAGYVAGEDTTNLVIITSVGSATISHVNRPRGTNELILYTPQYAEKTYTDDSGTEVLVQMTEPTFIYPTTNVYYSIGTILQVRKNQGSTFIPFDAVVLSASGTKTTFLNQCNPGQQVKIQIHLKVNAYTGKIPAQDWTRAFAFVGGQYYTVISSQVPVADWSMTNSFVTTRHPRTCVAYNSTYIYFIVADGRTTNSIGMSLPELGYFCRDTLGAEFAVNLDGGGSSTLWVNGQVKNYPSGGTERANANGLMMINVIPMNKSSLFYSYATVTTVTSTQVRLGPGTNYDVITTLAGNKLGVVTNHSLNGIYAKGQYWWRVDFDSCVGWVAEGAFALVPIQLIDFEAYPEVSAGIHGFGSEGEHKQIYPMPMLE